MTFPDLVARLAPPLIFYPQRLSEREADPRFWGLSGAESLYIETEDGERLHAWWMPAAGPRSTADAPEGAIGVAEAVEGFEPAESCAAAVFFHGNAGNIVSRAPIAARFSALGLAVLLVDYRGYGRSSGKPSEEGLFRDGRAAYRHLVEVQGVPAGQLVVVGNSLGAAVATSVAAENPVGRLVLTGAFRSVPALANSIYWWMPGRAFDWSFNLFDAESRVREVQAPVLVGRGMSDRLIPREQTRAVYEAAPDPKRWFEVPGADHNDLWFAGELWSEVSAFINDAPCSPR